MYEELANALAELEEDSALHSVKSLYSKGVPAIEILYALQKGMEQSARDSSPRNTSSPS